MMPEAPLAQITPLFKWMVRIAMDVTHPTIAQGYADAAATGARITGSIFTGTVFLVFAWSGHTISPCSRNVLAT